MNQYIVYMNLGYEEIWAVVQAYNEQGAKYVLLGHFEKRNTFKYRLTDIKDVRLLEEIVDIVTSVYHGD